VAEKAKGVQCSGEGRQDIWERNWNEGVIGAPEKKKGIKSGRKYVKI
jgi:hypothetical protein